jgi:hypothetical protein
MALYRILFFDQDDHISSLHRIEHDDDEAAVANAHQLNSEAIQTAAAGFELWQDDRLVQRHSNKH